MIQTVPPIRNRHLVREIDRGRVRELLVVCNSSIPESRALADYYMSPDTGRAIDPGYRLELPLAKST